MLGVIFLRSALSAEYQPHEGRIRVMSCRLPLELLHLILVLLRHLLTEFDMLAHTILDIAPKRLQLLQLLQAIRHLMNSLAVAIAAACARPFAVPNPDRATSLNGASWSL